MILSRNQTLLTDAYTVPRLKGRYFLTGFVSGVDNHNESYHVLTLSDCTCSINVFCRDRSCINGKLQPQTMTAIEAVAYDSGKGPYMRLKYAEASSTNSITDLQQLPRCLLNEPEDLDELLMLVSLISNISLKRFCIDVFCLEEIGIKFIQCPASLKYHHNYRGGLIKHSLEVMKKALRSNKLNSLQKDIATVAGLFHDIGKTLTFTTDCTRTDLGWLVDHQELTLEICAPALKNLSSKEPKIANELRHIWTCASPNAKYGFKPKTHVANIIRQADGLSAFR